MRRRILIPIDDKPEPTEDTIRASLLNWLSQPVVVSATAGADADLIRVYTARNLTEYGRASMVHPFKTCRVPYETAKNQLRNIFPKPSKKTPKLLGQPLMTTSNGEKRWIRTISFNHFCTGQPSFSHY